MLRTVPAVAALLLLAGCGGAPEERPGNPEVYASIEATSDCRELQAAFDRADKGPDQPWKAEYMKAADKRMREVGCY